MADDRGGEGEGQGRAAGLLEPTPLVPQRL
jgi:hypothetical protein